MTVYVNKQNKILREDITDFSRNIALQNILFLIINNEKNKYVL